MPIAELAARVEKAEGLARQIIELFPGLTTLTTEERTHTAGRFRDGESAALSGVLDAVRLRPALFASLADQDEGHEPDRFETELIAERLARRDLLARVDVLLDPLADRLNDTVLRLWIDACATGWMKKRLRGRKGQRAQGPRESPHRRETCAR
jgi:hypothetical protein